MVRNILLAGALMLGLGACVELPENNTVQTGQSYAAKPYTPPRKVKDIVDPTREAKVKKLANLVMKTPKRPGILLKHELNGSDTIEAVIETGGFRHTVWVYNTDEVQTCKGNERVGSGPFFRIYIRPSGTTSQESLGFFNDERMNGTLDDASLPASLNGTQDQLNYTFFWCLGTEDSDRIITVDGHKKFEEFPRAKAILNDKFDKTLDRLLRFYRS